YFSPAGIVTSRTRTRSVSRSTLWFSGAARTASRLSGHGQVAVGCLWSNDGDARSNRPEPAKRPQKKTVIRPALFFISGCSLTRSCELLSPPNGYKLTGLEPREVVTHSGRCNLRLQVWCSA